MSEESKQPENKSLIVDCNKATPNKVRIDYNTKTQTVEFYKNGKQFHSRKLESEYYKPFIVKVMTELGVKE
jgi:hypothetical protein